MTISMSMNFEIATLQAAIRALGTVDSVDLSGATVNAKTLVIAV